MEVHLRVRDRAGRGCRDREDPVSAERADGGEHGYVLTRVIEEDVRHAAAVYERLKPLRDSLRPDLIVGHSGLGPTLFLPDLFPATPLISTSRTSTSRTAQRWHSGPIGRSAKRIAWGREL